MEKLMDRLDAFSIEIIEKELGGSPQYAVNLRLMADLGGHILALRNALDHAVRIAEDKQPGTWDDLLQYRQLLNE